MGWVSEAPPITSPPELMGVASLTHLRSTVDIVGNSELADEGSFSLE
jgi:hypothetical protein